MAKKPPKETIQKFTAEPEDLVILQPGEKYKPAEIPKAKDE